MSTTNPVVTCPECGSRNVRWRRSRPTDAVLNYLRFITDRLFSGTGSGLAYGGTETPGYAGQASGTATRYDQMRDVYEVEAGSKTPAGFWRCPDCKKKGQVYDGDIDKTLGLASEMGAEESYLEDSGGSVHKPVGGQGHNE